MTRATGGIAAVVGADSVSTQALFAAIVTGWRALGTKVVGVIGEPHGLSGCTCTAGILRDIVSGKPHQIRLETPPNHTSCETACVAVINDTTSSSSASSASLKPCDRDWPPRSRLRSLMENQC
jgi:Protein of unknown function (DUF2478)